MITKFLISPIIFLLGIPACFITFTYLNRYSYKIIKFINIYLGSEDYVFLDNIAPAILRALLMFLIAYAIYKVLVTIKLTGLGQSLVIIFFSSYLGAAFSLFIVSPTISIINRDVTGFSFILPVLPVTLLTSIPILKFLNKHIS